MDRGYPQSLIENLLSEFVNSSKLNYLNYLNSYNKTTRTKRNIAFPDTIPALSVYYKGSLNEKMEFYTKPTITSINF